MNKMREFEVQILLHLFCVVCAYGNVCSTVDTQALLSIKEELSTFSRPFNLSSWNTGTDCCLQWEGVSCDYFTGAVSALTLAHYEYEYAFTASNSPPSEQIPPGVCDLKNLQTLRFALIQFDGNIPPCIWSMKELHELSISSTGYQQPMVSTSGNVSNSSLQTLYLSKMHLTGKLPAWVGELPQLTSLDVSDNMLIDLPESLSNLSNLNSLYVGSNLIKHLPKDVGKLSNLYTLSAANNSISDIPPSIGTLSSLYDLYLSENLITSLPPSIAQLSNLGELDLQGNLLTHLPHSSGNLSNLMILYLGENNLTDIEIQTFPNMFPQLAYLFIDNNALTTVPKFLRFCPRLRSVSLNNNLINHLTWMDLDSMPQLYTLNLSQNLLSTVDFSGSSSAFNLSSINFLGFHSNYLHSLFLGNISVQSLDLSKNKFRSIPVNIYRLPSLYSLDIGYNELRGEIPSDIEYLSLLTSLHLQGNNLSGAIPKSLNNLTRLNDLDLSRNQLRGVLDSNLLSNASIYCDTCSLRFLSFNLSENYLSGTVPGIACGGTKDVRIAWDLSHNLLTGPLPSPFASDCSTVDGSLLLSNIRLEGAIPESFMWDSYRNVTRFQVLDLSSIKLEGTLLSNPLGTCEPIKEIDYRGNEILSLLDLSDNKLTGSIPRSSNCSAVQRLKLGGNFLRGTIPESFGYPGTPLRTLSLRNNDLHGQIPPSLGNCTDLEVLDLSGNRLTGPLPDELRSLNKTLRVFTVAHNRLSGPFPAWIDDFRWLQVFDLSDNMFESMIPESLNFSNLFGFVQRQGSSTSTDAAGTIYSEKISLQAKGGTLEFIYVLTLTTYFGVANNGFYGAIPGQLASLQGLRYMTFAGNRFNGSIPESLADLRDLESLDLSDNELSGGIPQEFSQLTFLAYFNVSYNRLSGPIPGGQVSKFSPLNFVMNSGLCDTPLPKCSVSPPPLLGVYSESYPVIKNHILDEWISPPAVGVGFSLGFAAITLYFLATNKLKFLPLLFSCKSPKPIYCYNKPYGFYTPRL